VVRVVGVGIDSLKESIDTTTSDGKLVFHLFAALAEFERDIIRERTQAGLTAARARGRKGGRPTVLPEKKRAIAQALRKDPSHSVAEICRALGISRTTFYRYTEGEAPNAGTPAATRPSAL
jgi:DNA invertase Pin-like site-specific DNA recombinase